MSNGNSSKNLRNGSCSKNLRNGNCSKNIPCYICFDDKADTHFLDGICKFRDHAFCSYCISKYVGSEINKSVHDVKCPYPECSVVLKPQFLRTILPSEVVEKWESRRCEYSIVGSQRTYCPFKDCSGLLVNESEKVVTSAECPYCHRLFCAQCRVPWHGNMSCGEFQRKNKDPDAKFFKLAKEKNWQKCVECSMYVQKLDGCEHVTCRYCYSPLIFTLNFVFLGDKVGL